MSDVTGPASPRSGAARADAASDGRADATARPAASSTIASQDGPVRGEQVPAVVEDRRRRRPAGARRARPAPRERSPRAATARTRRPPTGRTARARHPLHPQRGQFGGADRPVDGGDQHHRRRGQQQPGQRDDEVQPQHGGAALRGVPVGGRRDRVGVDDLQSLVAQPVEQHRPERPGRATPRARRRRRRAAGRRTRGRSESRSRRPGAAARRCGDRPQRHTAGAEQRVVGAAGPAHLDRDAAGDRGQRHRRVGHLDGPPGRGRPAGPASGRGGTGRGSAVAARRALDPQRSPSAVLLNTSAGLPGEQRLAPAAQVGEPGRVDQRRRRDRPGRAGAARSGVDGVSAVSAPRSADQVGVTVTDAAGSRGPAQPGVSARTVCRPGPERPEPSRRDAPRRSLGRPGTTPRRVHPAAGGSTDRSRSPSSSSAPARRAVRHRQLRFDGPAGQPCRQRRRGSTPAPAPRGRRAAQPPTAASRGESTATTGGASVDVPSRPTTTAIADRRRGSAARTAVSRCVALVRRRPSSPGGAPSSSAARSARADARRAHPTVAVTSSATP